MLHRHNKQPKQSALMAVILLTVMMACNRGTAPGWNEGDRNQPHDPNAATEEEWAGRTTSHLEELFEGRFPGVQVFRAGDGIQVRIRGTTSILGDTEPLYVVDGMTIEPGPGGALFGINPSDIAKIEVLKDVSATSLYGGRGANGVILIHMRKEK